MKGLLGLTLLICCANADASDHDKDWKYRFAQFISGRRERKVSGPLQPAAGSESVPYQATEFKKKPFDSRLKERVVGMVVRICFE